MSDPIDLIDELERMRAEGTQGEWLARRLDNEKCDGITVAHSHGDDLYCFQVDDCPAEREIVTTDSGVYGPMWKDAVLIVGAVNALPRLIAAIRAADALDDCPYGGDCDDHADNCCREWCSRCEEAEAAKKQQFFALTEQYRTARAALVKSVDEES